jgi:hypothetical protein
MARKSSNMAKLNDLVASLTGLVKEVQDEMAGYMEDAEKYRELKPVLNKLANRTASQDSNGGQPDKTPEELAAEKAAAEKAAADQAAKQKAKDDKAAKKKAAADQAAAERKNS